MTYAAAYALTLALFTIIDLIWLGVVAKDFYRTALSGLMADRISLAPAVVFYLIYAAGLMIFAIAPSLKSGSVLEAAIYGALFGFFCYATYDLTNLATLRGWPLQLSLVDMAWGSLLSGVVAAAVCYFVK